MSCEQASSRVSGSQASSFYQSNAWVFFSFSFTLSSVRRCPSPKTNHEAKNRDEKTKIGEQISYTCLDLMKQNLTCSISLAAAWPSETALGFHFD
jgi:hypothetical protein